MYVSVCMRVYVCVCVCVCIFLFDTSKIHNFGASNNPHLFSSIQMQQQLAKQHGTTAPAASSKSVIGSASASAGASSGSTESGQIQLPPFVKRVVEFLQGIPKKALAQAAFRCDMMMKRMVVVI